MKKAPILDKCLPIPPCRPRVDPHTMKKALYSINASLDPYSPRIAHIAPIFYHDPTITPRYRVFGAMWRASGGKN